MFATLSSLEEEQYNNVNKVNLRLMQKEFVWCPSSSLNHCFLQDVFDSKKEALCKVGQCGRVWAGLPTLQVLLSAIGPTLLCPWSKEKSLSP